MTALRMTIARMAIASMASPRTPEMTPAAIRIQMRRL